MRVNVKTGKYQIIGKVEWRRRLRKAIILEREDWVTLKTHLYETCAQFKCADELDLISAVFERIDEAVGKVDKLINLKKGIKGAIK